ncbi:hypothetical protein N5B96_03045 [Acinetobacter johnsonii]|uniref:hypothetical protein n=1 Tax=Acinetobacter johnsonii TaxID=40214 RepID=UPI00244706DE|nr:hypothetical protein [Acinetobacter johnsonii]MDH1068476.1 hypothetical protein [Acinetobacter johnsonii]
MKDFIKQNMSSVINWLLTLGWMAIVFYLWQYSGIKKPDELNAVGDFLAGVFAPLAFFWLVRGYYQQGEELRQNTQALKMQSDELANSVLQQQHIVALTREELEITKKELERQRKLRKSHALPIFHFLEGTIHFSPHLTTFPEFIELQFKFYNSKTIARNVMFHSMGEDFIFKKNNYEIVDTFGLNNKVHLELSIKFKSDALNLEDSLIYNGDIVISFIDNEGELTQWDFLINLSKKVTNFGTSITGKIIKINN